MESRDEVRETHEFLLRTMEENWLLARQAEEKRATVATVNLILASGIHGIFAFTGFSLHMLPLTLWMSAMGAYGVIISLKLYERSHYHILRARKLRARLDELCSAAQVEQLLHKSEEEHKQHYKILMKVRLNALWVGLHVLIAVLGLVYTAISVAA